MYEWSTEYMYMLIKKGLQITFWSNFAISFSSLDKIMPFPLNLIPSISPLPLPLDKPIIAPPQLPFLIFPHLEPSTPSSWFLSYSETIIALSRSRLPLAGSRLPLAGSRLPLAGSRLTSSHWPACFRGGNFSFEALDIKVIYELPLHCLFLWLDSSSI